MLVFDIELLSIVEGPKPIAAPKDVAKAPKSAKVTASGLAYKVLKKGKGKKPTAADRVEVHYTGWTTDGKMFDSSVARGHTATFGLRQVIAGWTEGVQLMPVGSKFMFYIKPELAYGEGGGGPIPPNSTLIFQVELLAIEKSE